MRLIKRYKNRRLYDTETSKSITQVELAAIIRAGHQVQVIDSSTGEDITLNVLGRTLLGEAADWENISESKELFREIIYLGGDKSMSLLKNTILASIGVIQVTKEKAEKIIDDLIKKGDLDKSDRKNAVMELLAKAEKSTAGFREKVAKEAESVSKSASKLAKDLAWAKQADMKKLEAKVTKLAKTLKAIEAKLNA